MNNRFRNIIILVIVITICIAAATITFRDNNFIPGSRSALIDFFSPIQERVFGFLAPVGRFFGGIGEYVNLREKYTSLQQENLVLRQSHVENISLRLENKALREMLDMEIREQYPTQPARVIGFYQGRWQSEALLNVGRMHGVEEGMGVVNKEGLVGIVNFVADSNCKVRLINDPSSNIGATILTSRAIGVLEGTQEKRVELKYIQRDAHVYVGDIVVTSELSQKLPPDVLIGRIRHVEEDIEDVYKHIEIEPFVDFKSLEYVMVIKRR